MHMFWTLKDSEDACAARTSAGYFLRDNEEASEVHHEDARDLTTKGQGMYAGARMYIPLHRRPVQPGSHSHVIHVVLSQPCTHSVENARVSHHQRKHCGQRTAPDGLCIILAIHDQKRSAMRTRLPL